MNFIFKSIGYNLNNFLISCSYHRLDLFYNVKLRSYSNSSRYYRYKKERFPSQVYDAFLVLDFESTCLPGYSTIKQNEIIEFPCIWVNGSNLKVVEIFHKYVKPVVNPVIDPFCTQLTGITNEMVENEKTFPFVLEDFMTWYDQLIDFTKAKKIVFVTDGNWDLDFMLPEQCRLSKMAMPKYMKNWINIRESFQKVAGKYPKTLTEMLISLDIRQEGKLHQGLDDSLNIYKIFKNLAERGHLY